MQGKLAFVYVIITLALFALGIVIATIGYEDNEEYAKIVLAQQDYDSRVIAAQRGSIVDRNGTVLATNEPVYNLILDPKVILNSDNYTETTINALVDCFGYDKEGLTELIEKRSSSSYVRYVRQMSQEDKERFEALQAEINEENKKNDKPYRVRGVWFETEYRRVYPYGSLASQILGFSSSDGTSGSYGLEQYYNDHLSGTNGREYGYLSDESNLERVTKPAVDGDKLVTTIDANIQRIVEEAIASFMDEIGAKNVGVVVMNPKNGEILALGTSTPFDLNNPGDLSAYYTEAQLDPTNVANLLEYYKQEEIDKMSESERAAKLKVARQNSIWRNYCISAVIEPGSTAKPFTIAAALEEGIIKLSDTFLCDGSEVLPGGEVHCNKRWGHGVLTLRESLMQSCNDALMHIGLKVGAELFTKYQGLFNFGMKTGIDLPGEERGLVWDAEDITTLTLATESFGQNYNVTMVQMAAAYCSILNGGTYYEPHLVRQILDEDGNVKNSFIGTVVRETISDSTCEFLKDALLATVDGGTGGAAKIAGYEVGGKTGTAEKYPRGNDKYLVSFVGFLPYDDPEVVVYVAIDEPNVEKQDQGGYAIHMTRKILEKMIPYMNLYPTREVPEGTVIPGVPSRPSVPETDPNEGEGNTGEDGPGEGTGETPGESDPSEEGGSIFGEGAGDSIYEDLQENQTEADGPAIDD